MFNSCQSLPFLLSWLAWFNLTSCQASVSFDANNLQSLDLLSLTMKDVSALLQNNSITSEKLVGLYIARIQKNNLQGLKLRAILEIAPSAINEAKILDAERRNGKIRSDIHGVPIIVKDNIATDISLGMNTTAGSFAFLGSRVPGDADVVSQLRKAGAIILAKSNLSELMMFKGLNYTSGWSARGLQTLSAYVQSPFFKADPQGSSSGSAVALSAGWCAASIGTETDGSLIFPANRAALYSIKPTVGLISTKGVIPISKVQDSIGPMGKSAYDIAVLLTIMATNANEKKNYVSSLITSSENPWKGIRLGIPRQVFLDKTIPTVIYNATIAAIDKIKGFGASVTDPAEVPSANEFTRSQAEPLVLATSFKEEIGQYLSTLQNSQIKSLLDLVTFNTLNANIEFAAGECCQEILQFSQTTLGTNTPIYQAAVAENVRLGATQGIDAALDKYGLDALLVPSEGLGAKLAAIVGYPIITVPLGLDPSNIPLGLSFIGKKYSEQTLIKIMSAFEKTFPARRIPTSPSLI